MADAVEALRQHVDEEAADELACRERHPLLTVPAPILQRLAPAVARRLQRWAYFFEPPTWSRKQGCEINAEALGEDDTAAVERAETVLLPGFDSWRSRGLTDLGPPALVSGNGTRAGSRQIGQFTKGFVDAVYAKLLIVEERDKNGNIIHRERPRFANAAVVACRRAWFVGHRAREKNVPAINPFSRMGLKARAPNRAARETPTATWVELVAFCLKANEMGYRSVATAALLSWE